MKNRISHIFVLGVVATAMVGLPIAAQAYWYRGYWRPGIVVVPPPVYYAPPPVYYAPPPVYYTPPAPFKVTPPDAEPGAAARRPAGASCNAASAMCPMEVSRPVGATCYCGVPGGRAYGTVQ